MFNGVLKCVSRIALRRSLVLIRCPKRLRGFRSKCVHANPECRESAETCTSFGAKPLPIGIPAENNLPAPKLSKNRSEWKLSQQAPTAGGRCFAAGHGDSILPVVMGWPFAGRRTYHGANQTIRHVMNASRELIAEDQHVHAPWRKGRRDRTGPCW